MKHTALPWKVYYWDNTLIMSNVNNTEPEKHIASMSFSAMPNTKRKEAEANAEFIVYACNCHEELVEACRLAAELYHEGTGKGELTCDENNLCPFCAALANATK